MRFLFGRVDPSSIKTVLIIQTCNPDLLAHVAVDVRERFPQVENICLLIQRGMTPYLPRMKVDRIFENMREHRRRLISDLRAEHYDAVCFVESGEAGFWKLKLLPLLLSPRTVWVYDKLAQAAVLNLRELGRFFQTVFSGQMPTMTTRRMMTPFTFWRLWRFYRRRTRLKCIASGNEFSEALSRK